MPYVWCPDCGNGYGRLQSDTAGRSPNRAAGYLQYTTTNVIDALGIAASESGIAEVTEAQLAKAGVDCVIFTGMDRGGTLTGDDVDELVDELAADEKSEVRAMKGTPTGAYGVYMNAVDYAFAMAVDNAFVYSDFIQMEDAVPCFYEMLYHVQDGDAIATVIDDGFKALEIDGQPVDSDFGNSQTENVDSYQAVLDDGFDYYLYQIEIEGTVPEGLQLSGYFMN